MGGPSREKGSCHSLHAVFLLPPRSGVSGQLGGRDWAFPRLLPDLSYTFPSGVGVSPRSPSLVGSLSLRYISLWSFSVALVSFSGLGFLLFFWVCDHSPGSFKLFFRNFRSLSSPSLD